MPWHFMLSNRFSFILEVAISSSVLELKYLVQNQLSPNSQPQYHSFSPYHVVSSLAAKLPDIKHPAARACVVWMVGQYAAVDTAELSANTVGLDGVAYWAPDVLRQVVKSFVQEVGCSLMIDRTRRN